VERKRMSNKYAEYGPKWEDSVLVTRANEDVEWGAEAVTHHLVRFVEQASEVAGATQSAQIVVLLGRDPYTGGIRITVRVE
jgi:hypothetical protein